MAELSTYGQKQQVLFPASDDSTSPNTNSAVWQDDGILILRLLLAFSLLSIQVELELHRNISTKLDGVVEPFHVPLTTEFGFAPRQERELNFMERFIVLQNENFRDQSSKLWLAGSACVIFTFTRFSEFQPEISRKGTPPCSRGITSVYVDIV